MLYIGSDHGGFSLKETLKAYLSSKGVAIEDRGAPTLDPGDDYPQYAMAVAKAVLQDKANQGILICRSGGGMGIAANRFKGIRAVEVVDEKSAIHAREHNNANIMTLSAEWMDEEVAKHVVDVFLSTPFSGEERHIRRIQELDNL